MRRNYQICGIGGRGSEIFGAIRGEIGRVFEMV
jgi:hypothetical protein